MNIRSEQCRHETVKLKVEVRITELIKQRYMHSCDTRFITLWIHCACYCNYILCGVLWNSWCHIYIQRYTVIGWVTEGASGL